MEPVLATPRRRWRTWSRTAIWLKERYNARNAREGKITLTAALIASLFGIAAMWAAIMGMPTGLGTAIDFLLFGGAAFIAMAIVSFVLSIILSMLYLPIPRRLASIWCFVAVQTFVILDYADFTSLGAGIIGALYATVAVSSGCLIGLLLRSIGRVRRRGSKIAWATAFLTATVAALAVSATPADVPSRGGGGERESQASVAQIDAPNPAERGQYSFRTFSYGSGEDRHRDLFAHQTELISSTVDASEYITHWSRLKSLFWGFDERSLPLNGRVWMPEGDGTYPLALIVHGNHLMEYFSDGGYAYLGELLASKGIIAVSVDANFFNYSAWSSIPNDDMKMRAWLLLKHLQQLQYFDKQEGTAFSHKVDWNQIALIGHSRGGQAVAMAADYKKWFAEDASLTGISDLTIQSVVAIAPTDKRVDNKSASLMNVNYLTIQGARDADVNNFYGERQYNRAGFDEATEQFKASLYIADANHSQFNSDWGTMDERLPGGLFLNRKNLLEAEEQRLIAKVYISAFLEATLQGKLEYKALFQNYQSGLSWLPDTVYVSRYEGADFVDARIDSGNPPADQGDASGLVLTEQASAVDRDGIAKGAIGTVLQWEEPGAEYTVELAPSEEDDLEGLRGGSLVFSISNLEWELLQMDLEEDDLQPEPEGSDGANDAAADGAVAGALLDELPPLPEVEVVLRSESGQSVSIGLADVMPPQPPVYTSFLTIGWLENRVKNNKYKQAVEAVFQTYILPIDDFTDEEGERLALAPDEISSISFRFESGPGKVMVDDIGFMPQGGTYVEYE